MSAIADFKELISNNLPIDSRVYEDCIREYPYFLLPYLLKLQRSADSLDSLERDELIARLAMMLPERTILYSVANAESALFDSFYPSEQEREVIDTDSTIDNFLNTFGKTSAREEELIAQQIFNPTPEYATLLAAEFDDKTIVNREDLSENDKRINDFILNRETPAEPTIEPSDNTPVDEPTESDDTMLSESLAKIYIKQGKYTKALEIITKISLTNSEKSVYFADQIRFLKKLIINERFKV